MEVGKLKRTLMYRAVRWFGGAAWSANAERNRAQPGWKIVDPATLGVLAAGEAEPVSPDSTPLTHDRENGPSVQDVREAVDAARDG